MTLLTLVKHYHFKTADEISYRMKSPAQFLDHSVNRNMHQWETSPNKKMKLNITEEYQSLDSEGKHNFTLFWLTQDVAKRMKLI